MAENAVQVGIPLDDFVALGHNKRIEVVDGEVVELSPTQRFHARIIRNLYAHLREYLRDHPSGEIWQDNQAYVLDADPRTDWVKDCRIPDVSYVSSERLAAHNEMFPDETGPMRLAPDFAVEVVSPTDAYNDVLRKVDDYLRFGTQLVWVVSADIRQVRVYTPANPDGKTLKDDDSLTGDPVLPGFHITVRDVLDGEEF